MHPNELDVRPIVRQRERVVSSWYTGRHMPQPYHDGDRWRCRACGLLLTRYVPRITTGRPSGHRLRHHPRGRQ